MKTLRNLSASLFTLSAALLLSLTSCQKDELTSPNALTPAPVDQAADINPDGNKQQIITIQRDRNNKKYQMIEIFSNGELIATEYQNGSLHSKKAIALSSDQLNNVKNQIRKFDLSTLEVQPLNKNLPTISVAIQDNSSAKSIFGHTYEHGVDNLNSLVGQIEELINTSELFTNRNASQRFPVSQN